MDLYMRRTWQLLKTTRTAKEKPAVAPKPSKRPTTQAVQKSQSFNLPSVSSGNRHELPSATTRQRADSLDLPHSDSSGNQLDDLTASLPPNFNPQGYRPVAKPRQGLAKSRVYSHSISASAISEHSAPPPVNYVLIRVLCS